MTHQENKQKEIEANTSNLSRIEEDYLTQEAARIIDGEMNEQTDTWDSFPINELLIHFPINYSCCFLSQIIFFNST